MVTALQRMVIAV